MDPSPWRPNQDNTTGIHGRSQPCPLPSTHALPHIGVQDFPEAFSSSGFIWEQAALVKITLCSRTENKMSRQTKHLHFPNILKSSGVSRDGRVAKGPGGPAWPLDGWLGLAMHFYPVIIPREELGRWMQPRPISYDIFNFCH